MSEGWAMQTAGLGSTALLAAQEPETWQEEFTLAGRRQLNPDAPVRHLSWFEADAYARWCGARLPLESEWEVARQQHGDGLEQSHDAWAMDRQPLPALSGIPPRGRCRRGIQRQVHELTIRASGQLLADSPGHERDSYRNFFPHEPLDGVGFKTGAMTTTQPTSTLELIDLHPAAGDLRDLVRDGLSRRPKQLPAWMLYDTEGSRLFAEICQQPEYTLTRTEIRLLEDNAADIAEAVGDGVMLEFGIGNARKVDPLLRALRPSAFVALDISRSALSEAWPGVGPSSHGDARHLLRPQRAR